MAMAMANGPKSQEKIITLKTIEDIYFSLPMNLSKKALRIQTATEFSNSFFYFENLQNNHL